MTEQACHEVSQPGTRKAGPAQVCIPNFSQSFQGSGRRQASEYLRLCPCQSVWAIGRTIFPLPCPPPILSF